MELKGYQQHVLGELKDYIAAVAASKDVAAAISERWLVAERAWRRLQDILKAAGEVTGRGKAAFLGD